MSNEAKKLSQNQGDASPHNGDAEDRSALYKPAFQTEQGEESIGATVTEYRKRAYQLSLPWTFDNAPTGFDRVTSVTLKYLLLCLNGYFLGVIMAAVFLL